MLRIFTQKSFWLYLVIVVLVLSIFSFAQFGPSSTSKIKGLKVALVNEDQGPNGKIIKEKLQDAFDKSDAPIKWVSRSSLHSAKKGMENKEYYAAVIIPKNFTEQLLTLQTAKPETAKLELWVNQGMNAQAATAIQTIFAKVSNRISAAFSDQTLQAAEAHHLKLSPAQANVLAQPMTTETHLINKVGTHSAGGNAPVLLTMLVWLGGLTSSLLMWRTFKKMGNDSLSLRLTISQTLAGLVLAFAQALTLLTVVSGMMNLHVPDTSNLIWALTFSAFVYYLIQTAVLNWLGFKGWPIVILIWFFGSPLLPYPPEMLNHFFRYWIHSWVPVRFGMETIKDVLYFGAKADLWTMASILGYIGIGALILVLGAGWWQGRKKLKSV